MNVYQNEKNSGPTFAKYLTCLKTLMLAFPSPPLFQLSLRPLDDVPCVDRDSLDLSVSSDDPDRASYVTTSCHSSFPSHLTRYPELAIRAVSRPGRRRYVTRGRGGVRLNGAVLGNSRSSQNIVI